VPACLFAQPKLQVQGRINSARDKSNSQKYKLAQQINLITKNSLEVW